jgi:hypothetical protein
MGVARKTNFSDPQIKIRILKALGEVKPFGISKHFYMVKILRNMKRPNVITAEIIWNFLNDHFPEEKYGKKEDSGRKASFGEIFES